MAGTKALPGVARRKGRGGRPLPGYFFRYTKADGRRTLVFAGDTLAEANAFALRRLQEVTGGAAPPSADPAAPPAPSLAEYLIDYLPVVQMRVAPSTFRSIDQLLGVAAAYFKDTPLDRIRRGDVETWLARISAERGSKPNTLRRYHSSLSVLFENAIGRGVVEANPCRGIRLPKAQEIPIPFVSPEGLERIYACCPPEVKEFIVVLGETGLRLGEARALAWQDIAPDFDCITVGKSKSHRTRRVPLTPRATAAFRERERLRGPVPMVGKQPVFGEGFEDSWVRRLFKVAVRKAGFEGLRLHDLRHAFASALVQSGVPVPTVADLLGHATSELTLTRYGKHAPSNAGEKAIETLAKYRNQAPAAPPEEGRRARPGR